MFFFGWHEKGLLSFVIERVNLVYRINNTRLAFQTSITTIYRLQTSNLKSISKFQLLFHWKNFEKYMIFYALPWSRWNRTQKWWNTCVVPFAITELGQMSWSSTYTKKINVDLSTGASLYSAFESWRYFSVTFLNNIKIVKNQDGGLWVPLFDLKQCH